MSRRQIDPLRPLTAEERGWLARISLSHLEPAAHVARATMLLAVAAGQSYTGAAHAAGRRSGEAVAHLVSRTRGGAPLRRGRGPPRQPPARRGAARAGPWLPSSAASITPVWRPWNRDTAVGRRRCTPASSATGSWRKRDVFQTRSVTARRRGRLPHCSGHCGERRTACRG